MLMIDGDYPMAHGGVFKDRDLTLAIDQVLITARNAGGREDRTRPGTMASIPEMRRSGMAVALVKINRSILRDGHDHGEVRTDHHAYASGMAQLGYYQILEAMGESRLLKTAAEFREHMAEWQAPTATTA